MLKPESCRKAVIVAAASLLLLSQRSLAAQTDWIFVTDAVSGKQNLTVQIDLASLKREKNLVRYWVRYLDTDKAFEADSIEELLDGSSAVVRGPSLYQSNCATDQFRVLQGQIVFGYDGGLVPLTRPAGWEFTPPGSLASVIHEFVCSDPPKSTDALSWPGKQQN